ncbi:hypothetical protein XENTR_v10012981 [Xenopus tropicalis]|nr:hypothetical protein XENTR_v10012981 [Xenopus tropicalis]
MNIASCWGLGRPNGVLTDHHPHLSTITGSFLNKDFTTLFITITGWDLPIGRSLKDLGRRFATTTLQLSQQPSPPIHANPLGCYILEADLLRQQKMTIDDGFLFVLGCFDPESWFPFIICWPPSQS